MMCRLLLMNASAFSLIDEELEAMLRFLMVSFGGQGNGIAALWPDGKTRMSKSVEYDEFRTASLLRRYREQGAMWFVFHTRRATVGKVLSRNCHPFRLNEGRFVLAHNGHDPQFAQWGSLLGITDSECIARTWARLHLPLPALADVQGVFIGFHHGVPFVVKRSWSSDLVALWQHRSDDGDRDALLLASELPGSVSRHPAFDYVTRVGRLIATNEEELYTHLFGSHPAFEVYNPWEMAGLSEAPFSWLAESDAASAMHKDDA